MFTIQQPYNYLSNAVITIKCSLCVVVWSTPPLTPCVGMSVGVGMSELVYGQLRSCVKGLISFCVFTVSVLLGNILGGVVGS